MIKYLKWYKNKQNIIFIFIALFSLFVFIKLSEDLIAKELSEFDSIIYSYISAFISPRNTNSMRIISFLGSGAILITLSAASAVVFRNSSKLSFYSKMVGVNLIAVYILNEGFKVVFHRQRPDILRLVEVSGFSFPSGHSMIGLSFYGFLMYVCWKSVKPWLRYAAIVFFPLLIVSIGVSRIYLGVHYASDVLAGFSAGLVWLAVFIWLIKSQRIGIINMLFKSQKMSEVHSMSVFYNIVFAPEEAEKWISYEDNKDFAVSEKMQYKLLSETADGSTIYYIVNDNGEKAYNVWGNVRGDFVNF